MEDVNFLHILEEDESEDDHLFYETSSSEEDMDVVLFARVATSRRRRLQDHEIIARNKDYIYRDIPGFSAETFKSHFRMYPSTFEEVLRLIGLELRKTPYVAGRKPIEPKEQLLLTIWIMATPDSYRSVCEKFNVPKATAIRAVHRCTNALYCLAPRIISWPQGENATRVMHEFEQFSAFPKVIGAIDGTHIKIDAPENEKADFINRKGYPSIQVQAVCQRNCIFTSVFAGYAGSVHDARVFRVSPVKEYLENPEYFPDDSHLIGDAAYGVHPNIMVPFRDNGHLTLRQKNFNFCLSSARMSIERAFGIWKTRWRRVKDCLHMIKKENIPKFLVATCVLHNICILKNDLISYNTTSLRVARHGLLTTGVSRAEGNLKRQQIVDSLIIRTN